MKAVKMADGDNGDEQYINLDAIQTFNVTTFEGKRILVPRMGRDYEPVIREPYASIILALLLPPALPTAPASKCWAKQVIGDHESYCTLPKGHLGPCRYERPDASSPPFIPPLKITR